MKKEVSVYRLRKMNRELEARAIRAEADLYDYKQAVREIFDHIIETIKTSMPIKVSFILDRIRVRCLK